jgi:predicted DNA-binding transcriptional regulator AlpA
MLRRLHQNAGVINTSPQQAPSGETGFIDEKELLKRLPVSRRTLFSWRTTGKIPSVRLGGRRVLFHWPSIEAALLRMQKGGVQ